MLPDLLPAIVAAFAAAILMPLAIHASGFGQDDDFGGVQKVHVTPTSRLGGGVVVVAYTVALGFAARFATSDLPAGFPLLFCAIPVILVGLSEDVTRGIHPWHRVAAAVASAAVASFFAKGIIALAAYPITETLYSICRRKVLLRKLAGGAADVGARDPGRRHRYGSNALVSRVSSVSSFG